MWIIRTCFSDRSIFSPFFFVPFLVSFTLRSLRWFLSAHGKWCEQNIWFVLYKHCVVSLLAQAYLHADIFFPLLCTSKTFMLSDVEQWTFCCITFFSFVLPSLFYQMWQTLSLRLNLHAYYCFSLDWFPANCHMVTGSNIEKVEIYLHHRIKLIICFYAISFCCCCCYLILYFHLKHQASVISQHLSISINFCWVVRLC